jgi:Domain of unknown function (DUF4440)
MNGKRITLIAVTGATLALALIGAALASPQVSTSRVSQADRLRTLERTRLQALVDGDTAAARTLTAPDLQLINPAGVALTRGDFLGAIEAGDLDFLVQEPISPIAVRLHGNTAALRYESSFDLVVGGTRLTHEAWTTSIYERRHGRWQVVWAQTTAVPNNVGLLIEALKPPA